MCFGGAAPVAYEEAGEQADEEDEEEEEAAADDDVDAHDAEKGGAAEILAASTEGTGAQPNSSGYCRTSPRASWGTSWESVLLGFMLKSCRSSSRKAASGTRRPTRTYTGNSDTPSGSHNGLLARS